MLFVDNAACIVCYSCGLTCMQTSAHLLLSPATATTISHCGTTTHQLIAALSSSTAAAVATKIDSTRGKTASFDVASASLSYRASVRAACYSLINSTCCCGLLLWIVDVRFGFPHICMNISNWI